MRRKYDEKYYMRYGDPRTANWPLMNNVYNVLVISIVYLLLVKFVIPLWMRHRRPYDLRKVMIVYDIGMIFLNAWLFYQGSRYTIFKKNFRIRCQPVDFSFNEDALYVAEIGWIFFISKLVQLIETMIVLLRKRDSDLSVYHLPRHFMTPIVSWYLIKYVPGGYNTFLTLTNMFILMWTYLYAALATLGPSDQKYLWWKKYIIYLQLVLNSSIWLYTLQIYLFPPKSCKVSLFVIRLQMCYVSFILGLTIRLYLSSTRKRNKQKQGFHSTEADPILCTSPD